MRQLLFPAQWLYFGVTTIRNWLYDHKIFSAKQVSARVISIGNITVGGTGKTPTVLAFIRLMKEKGYTCGVVSRGYGRAGTGLEEVILASDSAAKFGDEPTLIKSEHPDIRIVVGAERVRAAEQALQDNESQFIICDDAFQHRHLHRDLNVVLIDALEKPRDYRMLPVGRARERVRPALARADLFVITKANQVESQRRDELEQWIRSMSDRPLIYGEYELKGFRNLKGERVMSLRDKCFLVTGVAKPESVEKTVDGKAQVVGNRHFPDHHSYSNRDVEDFLDQASKLQARWILTTSKDAIKLSQFKSLSERIWIVDTEMQFKGNVQALYEAIDRLARQSH